MIFCERPRENEPYIGPPGLGVDGGNRQFNAGIRVLTAKFGVLDWATNPPALWKDEVHYHMKKNGDRILRTVEAWAREARSSPVSAYDRSRGMMMPAVSLGLHTDTDLAMVLPELHKVLQKYGATYKPERFEPIAKQQLPHGGGRRGPFGRGGMYDGDGGGRGRGFGSGPESRFFGRGY